MPARRPDPAFGSDSGELSDAAQAAASVRFRPLDEQAEGKPLPPRGKHRRQVARGQLFGRIRARMYRKG
jgi:hypothetical protein